MKRMASLFLICSLFVLSVPATSRAVTPTPAAKTAPAVTVSPTPADIVPKVEYELPYPGILPTHPLYFFKSLRDRIIEMLISDPVNKSEFYILQADKKLNMALALKDLGKTVESGQAFDEAQANHDRAITMLESVMQSATSVPRHIIEKLNLSIAKHIEVRAASGAPVDQVRTQQARAGALLTK